MEMEDERSNNDTEGQLETMKIRLNDLEEENKKLRKTVNDLNESESKLQTEIGQYKLNLERIKRDKEKDKEMQENEKDELINEANQLLEDFNAEKHLIKAKIKKLLIEYCDLKEDSYQMDEEVDMDEYLIILEKELNVFTDRIRDESLDKISKMMLDLESGNFSLVFRFIFTLAQQQQTDLGVEIEKIKKENEKLIGINDELVATNGELEQSKNDFQTK